MNRQMINCICKHPEHMMSISYDPEDNQVLIEPLLTTGDFFNRLIKGIKYIFGHKSNTGLFSEIWIDKNEAIKIWTVLRSFK